MTHHEASRLKQLKAEFRRYGVHTLTPRERVTVIGPDRPLEARIEQRRLARRLSAVVAA